MSRQRTFHSKLVSSHKVASKAQATTHACLWSCAGMAVSFCSQVGAKQLILTHFSQRYKRSEDTLEPGDVTVDILVTEAQEAINEHENGGQDSANPNSWCTVSAADDFKTYTISARKST